MATQPNRLSFLDEDPSKDQKPSRARINGRRAAAVLLASAALIPTGYSPISWTAKGIEKAAGAIAGKVDQGFAVEQQGPEGKVKENPAIVEGPLGEQSNENMREQTLNPGEVQTNNPAVPSLDQLPDSQIPNANNGPGLHTT